MATAIDPRFVEYFNFFNCSTCEELYAKLEQIHKKHKPVEGEHVPFSLQDLKHLNTIDVKLCLSTYWSAYKADELIKYLRKNPPKESFENPAIQQCSSLEEYAAMMDLVVDVDLPASKFNPPGMAHYSDLFFDMYVGNYSDFNAHIKKLSKQELKKTLNTREGYPQYSPVFAPIIGIRLIYIERSPGLTKQNVKDIRLMYSGNNENKHFKILEKLLKLGADPNAHDILGNTPLYYALKYRIADCEKVVSILLRYGANPNYDSIFYQYVIQLDDEPEKWNVIDLLLSYNAKPNDYEEAMKIRATMEESYSLEFAVKIRELFPKKYNVCERTECEISAVKKCGACGFVVYCTPACQKLDWKFHKLTCKKKIEEKAFENSA